MDDTSASEPAAALAEGEGRRKGSQEPDVRIKAYVFTGSGDQDTNQSIIPLVKDKTLDSAIRLTTGPYGVIGAIIAEGTTNEALASVRSNIQKVRNAVNPPPLDVSIALRTIGPMGPIVWKPPIHGGSDDAPETPAQAMQDEPYKEPIGAFVRITTEAGAAHSVLQELPKMQGFWAAAIVSGSFDILLELGTETYDEMRHILARGLVVDRKPIPGVLSSVSCMSINPVHQSQVIPNLEF